MKLLLIISVQLICLAALTCANKNKDGHSRFSEQDYIKSRDDIFSDSPTDNSVEDIFYDLQHLWGILSEVKDLDKEKKDMMTYVEGLLGLLKVNEKKCTWKYYQRVNKLVRRSKDHDRPVDRYVEHHAKRLYNYCKKILDDSLL